MSSIKSNTVFSVNRSDIEDRFDPFFYDLKRTTLNKFKYPLHKLGKYFIIKDGDHDKLPEEAISNDREGKRYLRSQDLKNNKIISKRPVYVTNTYFQTVKRCHIYPGDLLFSIMASIGATAIVPDLFPICTANRAVGILRAKDDSQFMPAYVQAIINTNIGKQLLEFQKKGGIQLRINLKDIATLKLPLPDQTTQKKIIETYQKGIDTEALNKQQANNLEKSINDYLLIELEITLPKMENGFQSRIYQTSFKDLVGNKFDPITIKNKVYKIEGGKYTNSTLGRVAALVKGQSITSAKIVDGDYPVIAGGQSSPYNHNVSNFDGNIITVSASGAYSGFIWYHMSSIFASDCTVIKSKNENEVSTEYLSELLKFKQTEIYNLQQGAGQPHVYGRDLEKLYIPIPSLDKQNEIVTHINGIRTKARQLQEDAIKSLEQAKKEVEQMILGK